MAGYRFWLQGGLSIVLILTLAQAGWSQLISGPAVFPATPVTKPNETKAPFCKVYSLADMGDDPNLCKWIADTIPDVIQPGSWVYSGGAFGGGEAKRTLSYFAPAKILVINHTPAVHAQVDEFLLTLKKSVVQEKAAAKRDAQIVPAQFSVPDQTRSFMPMQAPAPQAPKHLLHFILGLGVRYEGEGIIDANVVKFAKALSSGASSSPGIALTPPARPSGAVEADDPVIPASGPTYLRTPPQYFPANKTPAPTMPPADPAPPATLPGVIPSGPPVIPSPASSRY